MFRAEAFEASNQGFGSFYSTITLADAGHKVGSFNSPSQVRTLRLNESSIHKQDLNTTNMICLLHVGDLENRTLLQSLEHTPKGSEVLSWGILPQTIIVIPNIHIWKP